jgi:glycogen phosphorylase
MSILNALRTGKFSSDRSIQDYADKVWKIKPCKVTDKVIESNE